MNMDQTVQGLTLTSKEWTFQELITHERQSIKRIASTVKQLKEKYKPLGEQSDQAECMANIMLAYRHLEDAAMRLGKVLQALDGLDLNNI